MMNTPLANKTTISTRNKMARGEGTQANNTQVRQSGVQLSSQIARNRALQPPSTVSSRLANLATGIPNSIKESNRTSSNRQTISTPKPPNIMSRTVRQSTVKSTFQQPVTKLPPHTANKLNRPSINNAIPNTSSRVHVSQSRLISTAPLTSRSSSILSSVSSANATKRPLVSCDVSDAKHQTSAQIPDTTAIRKGLAKFSNPIECQRQHQVLSLKIRQLNETVAAREKEVDELQDQLKRSIDFGVGFAITVQYFALKLKLDSDTCLVDECEHLKSRVVEFEVSEKEYNKRLDSTVEDYRKQLHIEQDLKNNLANELEKTRHAHSEELGRLKGNHRIEIDDLIEKNSAAEGALTRRIELLETELRVKNKELTDLNKEHELLGDRYNKLEESLTKDKDARVKYAQEKASQLQKDVDSLNSVLEMRTERIRALEKDSIMLSEVQNELMLHKDNEKALKQQLESVNAALAKKREQLENMMVELEQIRQELKRERKERRRMTMKTEMLEFLNESANASCSADSTHMYSSSMRDLDNLPAT